MTPKEAAEQAAKALNVFAKRLRVERPPCEFCRGTGRILAPLHGDPVLGYGDAGPCDFCKGTGKEKP